MAQHTVNIDNPSDLIAAVPTLLGFLPTDSAVVITLTGTRVGPTMRIDLADAPAAAEQVGAVIARSQLDTVFVLTVGRADERAVTASAVLAEAARGAGAEVRARLHVSEIVPGASWVAHDSDASGVVPDPSLAEAAVAATVHRGRSFAASRDGIAQMYAPAEPVEVTSTRVRALGDAETFARETFTELVGAVIGRAAVDVSLAMRVGVLFVDDVQARDAALALAQTHARELHDALTAAARVLDGAERAEVLTVAGFAAYLAGEGTWAGLAFEAAGECGVAMPRLAQLLDTALRQGLDQEAVTALAAVGAEVAAERGYPLPA